MYYNQDLGKTGEDLAVQHLISEGYHILERNWRSGHKEIDIIALKGDILAVVEVKTRKSEDYGNPDIAVDGYKQKMLISAADAYVRYKNLEVEVRFDIISIILNGTSHKTEHIEDAFYATPQNSRW
jgi:putative endonuclease